MELVTAYSTAEEPDPRPMAFVKWSMNESAPSTCSPARIGQAYNHHQDHG